MGLFRSSRRSDPSGARRHGEQLCGRTKVLIVFPLETLVCTVSGPEGESVRAVVERRRRQVGDNQRERATPARLDAAVSFCVESIKAYITEYGSYLD